MSTQLLTATGSSFLFGPNATIASKRAFSLHASGSAHSSGSAAVTRKLPVGGLTDFGLWHAGQPDVAMSRDMAHITGGDSTASRSWLTATAPTDYAPGGIPLWNAAVYAGIGIKWTNLANNEQHAYDDVQFESFSSGNRLSWDATSWEGRRCYTSQEGVTYSDVSTAADVHLSGSRSGMITYTGAPAGKFGYSVNPTPPKGMAPCSTTEVLNGAVSVNMERGAWWSAGLQFYDATLTQVGAGVWHNNGYQQHPGGGQWDTSYVYNISVPAGAVWVAVVPHICINSTPVATDSIAPVGEVAYCDMHRVWGRPYDVRGTPTTYIAPRKLTIDILANRVNLVNNPGGDVDFWGWGANGYGTAPFPVARDGSTGRSKPGAIRWTMPSNPGGYGLGVVTGMGLLTGWSTSEVGGFGWQPATTYTSSVYVRLGPECPPVSIDVRGYTATGGVLSTDDALASHPELIEGDWIRLWVTFTTSADDDGLVVLDVGVNSADLPVAGASFWVDDVVSEIGDQLLPYFDGGSPGADYLWAGTPSRSSSHYYRAFRSNAYRLSDIVQSVVPHGTQFQLVYAQPPE